MNDTTQNNQLQHIPADPLPMLKDGSIDMRMLQLNPNHMQMINNLAATMAASKSMIPKAFQGQQSDCAALIMQAFRWDMDPYAVASQAFIVSGNLGYSAQLINSVIASSSAVSGGFKYEYSDQAGWDKLAGHVTLEEIEGKTGVKSMQAISTGDRSALEKGVWAKCGCQLAGEDSVTWGEPVYLGDITTRNSPLWKTSPKQQLSYLCVKYWSRLYAPQVIMGVYTKDEIPEQGFENARDVTEKKPTETAAKPASSLRKPETQDEEVIQEPEVIQPEPQQDTKILPMTFEQVIKLLTDAATLEEVEEIKNEVVRQGKFIKDTEEHLAISAKLRARKLFFKKQDREADANDEALDYLE
jgi:hypothetical protein